ncbi:ATP-dependent DNA helicase RecG [Campylobacter sp. MIT 97-5078]|uniref:ATP-dependent DNA helicase RecG n=1 Tax=Campylobacter sp. MIT 97-5078 TaxID=1548153 RepID=UPI00051347BF|nr:ATP-dependent DNA helicase RecG [Campylobacter sp. MIT 97-5078]KGI56003.1 ATP-dependent DNA helicase RecG [Campylobacter sp. MIT 97-5078]TQR23559.1 ATP-dependent DNA helicase RecG [Campylobacter sp. MIT 97-5078]
MKIASCDLELFKKLRIKNAINLALLLPKKIENLSLSKEPKESVCTEEVQILESNFRAGKIFGLCYCKNWDIKARFIFFHPSKWHMGVFRQGKEYIFYAKMSFFNNFWQFNNPKIIKNANIFEPKYQIAGIKDENIAKLIQEYITKENLIVEGIDEKRANLLVNMHRYDEQSFEIFSHLENFLSDLKFVEIYSFLKRLRQKKTSSKAYEIKPFNIQPWFESLPFKPTLDQLNAINDIRADLSQKEAKRRIIMGDVGCGKTLVLLAAAISVYPKQALLMAPTSILANQLFNEAQRLLPNFMQVVFVKGGKREKGLDEKLAKAHLIIGTHTLIHQQGFEAVLVMIDEQHRFGSNQRQKISELASKDGLTPHFVQFSATPIPRTLSMIQSELVSFSFIKQMPFKKDIQSFCIQDKDFQSLLEKIKIELKQNNQVAIIYPLVNESQNSQYLSLEQAKQYWLKHFKGVYITHGKDKFKDEVLAEFKEKGQILLATTVVEVGISLPRLSTIIIVGAEKLGLATLHQLRGRVGRVGLKSFCYLYTKQKEIPKRLLEFAKTLDGFEIAELDLKNRLSGDLIDGFMQHGNEFKFFDFSSDETILEEAKKTLDKQDLSLKE